MKSISVKMGLAMTLCMVLSFSIISGIYTVNLRNLNHSDTERYVWMLCEEHADQFDRRLEKIELAVDLINYYSGYYLNYPGTTTEQKINMLRISAKNTAETVEDVHSVYFHANQGRISSDYDFYYLFDTGQDEPEELRPRNLNTYRRETGQEPVWYDNAARTGKACWVGPYKKTFGPRHIGKQVIAYTTPLYNKEKELVGVLGMEFSLTEIAEALHNIRIYKSGYLFLTDQDGTVLDHPVYDYGTRLEQIDTLQWDKTVDLLHEGKREHLISYRLQGQKKQMAATGLRNGMVLIAAVPEAEINKILNQTLIKCALSFFTVLLISMAAILVLIHRFLSPIRKLSAASQQIIEGNMDVELNYKSQDEVGVLTDNFRQMTLFLSRRLEKYTTMAYTDAMTGVKNKASYETAVAQLEERMEEGLQEFGLVVIDVNYLKRTNDELGHEAGDRLIKRVSSIICHSFAHSPVYRIGGDEFVVFLEREDYKNVEQCFDYMENLTTQMNTSLPENERVSFATGMTTYLPGKDHSYHDVFVRADQFMYENKRKMKRDNGDRPDTRR